MGVAHQPPKAKNLAPRLAHTKGSDLDECWRHPRKWLPRPHPSSERQSRSELLDDPRSWLWASPGRPPRPTLCGCPSDLAAKSSPSAHATWAGQEGQLCDVGGLEQADDGSRIQMTRKAPSETVGRHTIGEGTPGEKLSKSCRIRRCPRFGPIVGQFRPQQAILPALADLRPSRADFSQGVIPSRSGLWSKFHRRLGQA